MQKFKNTLWSGKCPFGEMSQWGNVQSGKCPVGELSVQGNVRRGSVRRGSVSRGFVLGKVSVGEVSGRETVLQSLYLLSFPPPCYMRHSQFFDKIDSFLKNDLNLLGSKKELFKLNLIVFLASSLFFFFWIPSENRTKLKKLFNLNPTLRQNKSL